MEQAQGEELGQERLPRRGVQVAGRGRHAGRPFAGLSFVLAGGGLAWALLGWAGEARARRALEVRQAELLARLETADEVRAGVLAEKARLERELLASQRDLGRQRASITELGRRLGSVRAGRRGAADAAPEAAARVQERVEFTRRLNRLLRIYGTDWVRFYEVGGHDGKVLADVRVLVMGEEGLVRGVFLARRCEIELDRASGRAALAMRDVTRVIGRRRFGPEAGRRVEFEPADPRAFELELEPWVVAKGVYPVPKPRPAAPAGDLEELALWRDRLTAFLDYAAGDARLDLHHLRGVGRGVFLGVEVLGYTKKGVWEKRIQAGKLMVWVDEDTGAVELRMSDGFVENALGRTTFPGGRTYRYPLPAVGRARSERLLTGFVHRFHSLATPK